MRRLIFIFAVLTLFGCSKDNKAVSTFSIVGKWQMIGTRSYSLGDCGCWKSISNDEKAIYHFKFDGTYTVSFPLSSSLYECTATYEVKDGNAITWTKCDPNGTASTAESHDVIRFEANDLVIEANGVGGPAGTLFRKVQ